MAKTKQKKIMSRSGARTRRNELVNLGLVKWTGRKRRNSKGGLWREWKAIPESEWKASQHHSQLDLDDVISERRAVARRTDPQTSWDAARSVKKIRASQRTIYYLLLKHGPMIDEEIYEKIIEYFQYRLL